jgi:hypothetical protein
LTDVPVLLSAEKQIDHSVMARLASRDGFQFAASHEGLTET